MVLKKKTDWHDVSSDLANTIDADGFNVMYSNKRIKSIDINLFHDQQGHQSEQLLRLIVQMYGIHLTGKLMSCEGCAMAKAKQKNVAKTTQTKTTEPGYLLMKVVLLMVVCMGNGIMQPLSMMLLVWDLPDSFRPSLTVINGTSKV